MSTAPHLPPPGQPLPPAPGQFHQSVDGAGVELAHRHAVDQDPVVLSFHGDRGAALDARHLVVMLSLDAE